ncbi:MAG: ribonuclease H family protein [Desulfosporosinus sp.]|nr:ribonuclease H family protein [Desulfosporosinus sp.]
MPKDSRKNKKPKFYVVFKGFVPGVYNTWDECQANVKGYSGASFASYPTVEEAEHAFSVGDLQKYKEMEPSIKKDRWMHSEIFKDGPCLTVDAACSGFPGPIEYRGVLLPSTAQVFRRGPFAHGSNNIGEFLAIVEGMRWLNSMSLTMRIYSDSKCAIGWVKGDGVCNTTLGDPSPELKGEIARAESSLRAPWAAKYKALLYKWDTETLGEIPSDFDRK